MKIFVFIYYELPALVAPSLIFIGLAKLHLMALPNNSESFCLKNNYVWFINILQTSKEKLWITKNKIMISMIADKALKCYNCASLKNTSVMFNPIHM